MNLAELIEKAIEERFEQKLDAARAVGVDPAILRAYAKGRRVPDDANIPKLALALGLDELELFRLKYQGTPLERHLGSPSDKQKRPRLSAMDRIEQLLISNNLPNETREFIERMCELVVAWEDRRQDK